MVSRVVFIIAGSIAIAIAGCQGFNVRGSLAYSTEYGTARVTRDGKDIVFELEVDGPAGAAAGVLTPPSRRELPRPNHRAPHPGAVRTVR